MSLVSASLEEFEAALAPIGGGVPDAEAYQRLSTMTLDHPLAARLTGLDPFSAAYRDGAMALYRDLSGRAGGYEPARDEQTGLAAPANPFTDLPPWSFRQPGLLSEFLLSWGQILRLLDAPGGASVLEYGCGSGQLLLVLARAGLRAHGVDIDPASVAAAREQAKALGVPLEMKEAPFGEGFAGRRFDRIVFFEAFHHAWDFERLLARLHERLSPGGRVVFCGEPIVHGPQPGIPFPWGPRLDALSVFCMRRWGWMELGFEHGFFLRLLRRSGWRVAFHPMPNCGRAHAYVAEPAPPTLLRPGEPDAMDASAEGWGPPEGTHRWTKEGTSVLTLPAGFGDGGGRLALRVSNPDAAAKRLVVSAGGKDVAVALLRPGEGERIVDLGRFRDARLSLRCDRETGGDAAEPVAGVRRRLGVAVHDVERVESTAAQILRAGGMVSLAKTMARPVWRRLPGSVRDRLRKLRP